MKAMEGLQMKKSTLAICFLVSVLQAFATEEIPMRFCGLKLGQIVPEGINPTSKTEVYYGYG